MVVRGKMGGKNEEENRERWKFGKQDKRQNEEECEGRVEEIKHEVIKVVVIRRRNNKEIR